MKGESDGILSPPWCSQSRRGWRRQGDQKGPLKTASQTASSTSHESTALRARLPSQLSHRARATGMKGSSSSASPHQSPPDASYMQSPYQVSRLFKNKDFLVGQDSWKQLSGQIKELQNKARDGLTEDSCPIRESTCWLLTARCQKWTGSLCSTEHIFAGCLLCRTYATGNTENCPQPWDSADNDSTTQWNNEKSHSRQVRVGSGVSSLHPKSSAFSCVTLRNHLTSLCPSFSSGSNSGALQRADRLCS